MNFEQEYLDTATRFANYLSTKPEQVYLTLGDSVRYLVETMSNIAIGAGLALPYFHTLNHVESWNLYTASDNLYPLIEQAVVDGKPKRINLLEDFCFSGDKLLVVMGQLRYRYGIHPSCTVMVASHDLSHILQGSIDIFEINSNLSSELYRRYHRR